jgi:subtilisin-like proprotein convertase family protein/Ca2+-binding EF-hand superfamily protein
MVVSNRSHCSFGTFLVVASIVCPAIAQTRSGQSSGDQAGIPGFGHVEGAKPVLGFGPDAELLVGVTKEDLDRAEERLERYDRNGDRHIDRAEARDGRWYDDPFQYDVDGDNRLSRTELARRYAKRRERETAGGGSGSGSRSRAEIEARERKQREEERRRREEEERRRRGEYRVSRQSWYLAETLMRRHDTNRDGHLDTLERRNMGIASTAPDSDKDREIDRSELARWLAEQESERLRKLPQELPSWFVARDADEDGQVTMAEFADEWTDEKLDEFLGYDVNQDGIIVPGECLAAVNRLRSEHSNRQFKIIPTKGTIRSVIDVEEDSLIADVDVQLSITHTHDDHLSAYLIGPEEETVELFTHVGRDDDHFQNTILDDEAPGSIVRARPPFDGRFQPEAVIKEKPSLNQFYGRSTAGIWTLLIEANSDRPGALHGWSLIFKTAEEDGPSVEDEPLD